MRKIVDDKLAYTLYEDLTLAELNFPLLERIYRSHCYGRDEPELMELSNNMFNMLDKTIFKNHPEFAIHKKFHNASVVICPFNDKVIQLSRISPTNTDRPVYNMNALIVFK